LEVAAEGIALTIRIDSRRIDMMPAIGPDNRSQPFIKAKRPSESTRIGGLSIGEDMPRRSVAADWGEPWRVKR
jgi:hypothetical protein